MDVELLTIYNGWAADLSELPRLPVADFRAAVIDRVARGGRLAALFGLPRDGKLDLVAVLAFDRDGMLELASAPVGASYESLTPECPQAHLFEREIAEQFGVVPLNHPWLKPVRFHRSGTAADAWGRAPGEPIVPGVADFFRVESHEIHEVAVGPVHAGIIEPGHFRFQCNGENVLHLEISLGYQHRGVETRLSAGPDPRSIHYVETAAGDTTIGHSLAYCHVSEALARCPVPARAQTLRGVALELERLANHTGDLGAMGGDVGYLPTSSFCGRLRGDFLNMTAVLCGNRFGRGFNRPGGVGFDLEPRHADDLRKHLAATFKDVKQAVGCLWTTPSVLGRFDGFGVLSREMAIDLGVVGPAARASGLERDSRYNFANGIFQFKQIPLATWGTGDIFARGYVRWLEIQHSTAFVDNLLDSLPEGPVKAVKPLLPAPNKIAVALTEGWRGEICHVAVTGPDGRFLRYKIVDPSFFNWMALAVAMRGQQVSDFPLCNKSFNLSYCGHDL